MSGKRELVTCENDTDTPKRKCHPEAPHVEGSNEPVNEKITAEFNDMCDDVIDMILCLLQLQDLANISDTSVRLKAIAGSVFSRRHVRHESTLISIDAFHYSNHYSSYYTEDYPIYCRYDALLRIAKVKIWFQLVRNFGGSIKHVRIQSNNFYGISISNALVQFVKVLTHETFFDDGVIRNVLKELPELKLIIVLDVARYRYSIFKYLLGDEWIYSQEVSRRLNDIQMSITRWHG